MGYFCRDFKGVNIAGTKKPWLFTSGCVGLLRCSVPLLDSDDEQAPATYTVRLGFHALPDDRAGRRVFDVKLQGKAVLQNYKIAETRDQAVVREFRNIPVTDNLVLELVPKTAQPDVGEAPLINFIEVIREDMGRISALR